MSEDSDIRACLEQRDECWMENATMPATPSLPGRDRFTWLMYLMLGLYSYLLNGLGPAMPLASGIAILGSAAAAGRTGRRHRHRVGLRPGHGAAGVGGGWHGHRQNCIQHAWPERASALKERLMWTPHQPPSELLMHTDPIFFQTIDWATIAKTEHAGVTGTATWQTLQFPGLRVRIVEYSPGYLADHWCQKGHIVHCLEGEFVSELQTGATQVLTASMTYIVSDEVSSHRSLTAAGVKLLIIDGDFLRLPENPA